ncbi:MAG: M56 family metallopeptidase [Bacteroidales bacterium]|jgi:TonB family protein|nr:M56 family metallopeptidase [Bacteroidales bacterium]
MVFHLVNHTESFVALAIFYVFYRRFLRKETFHKLNRIYLLTTLLFAVSVPYVDFELLSIFSSAKGSGIVHQLTTIKTGYHELGAVIVSASSDKFSWEAVREVLEGIYFVGVMVSALFFILSLFRIICFIQFGKKLRYGRYRIIETRKATVPFSLYNWIFINPEKYSADNIRQIIAHEKIHALQLHAVDLLIIELLVIVFWFNPLIYRYRKSIREVHEYLADEAVLKQGFDRMNYQQLIFTSASGNRSIGFTNSFSYSLSKNRLKMLTMMKSKKHSKVKLTLSIPLIIAFMIFFTNSADYVKASSQQEPATIEPEDTVKANDGTKKFRKDIYFTVEKMPRFQGKKSSHFRKFITENLKYPEEAVKNKLSGRVYLSFTIDKEGNLVDAEVVRSAHPLLDAEALRVTNLSPKWEPGENQGKKVNVRFTFPVIFSLEENKEK